MFCGCCLWLVVTVTALCSLFAFSFILKDPINRKKREGVREKTSIKH